MTKNGEKTMVFSPFTIKHENLQGFRLLVNPVFSLILQKSSFLFSCFTTKSLLLYLEIIKSDMRDLPCKPPVRLRRSSVLHPYISPPVPHISSHTTSPAPTYTISNQSPNQELSLCINFYLFSS